MSCSSPYAERILFAYSVTKRQWTGANKGGKHHLIIKRVEENSSEVQTLRFEL